MSTIVHTFTGKRVDLLAPQPEDICIEDIAHALAYSTRFNGQTRVAITIAQHCVVGSYLLAEPVLALAFLLHDAHEAYLGDLTQPVKAALREIAGAFTSFNEPPDVVDVLASRLDDAIAAHFGMCRWTIHNEDIKRVDRVLCQIEGGIGGLFPNVHNAADPVFSDYRTPWGHVQAEAKFLARFEHLWRLCNPQTLEPVAAETIIPEA